MSCIAALFLHIYYISFFFEFIFMCNTFPSFLSPANYHIYILPLLSHNSIIAQTYNPLIFYFSPPYLLYPLTFLFIALMTYLSLSSRSHYSNRFSLANILDYYISMHASRVSANSESDPDLRPSVAEQTLALHVITMSC